MPEKTWKRGWYKGKKDPNFRNYYSFNDFIKVTDKKFPYTGIKHKHGWKPQHLYAVRGNQFTISISTYY